jgi:hypothetical protein
MRLLSANLLNFYNQKQQPAPFEGNFAELKGAICYPSIDIYHRLSTLTASEESFLNFLATCFFIKLESSR